MDEGDGGGAGADTGAGNQAGTATGGNVGSGGHSGGPGNGGMTATGGSGGGTQNPVTPSHVIVVAHQDDDLLFINPDLIRVIDAGEPLVVVYVTSGNAGMDMAYVESREKGIQTAYANMAGVNNAWTCAPETYGAKSIRTCTLNANPKVQTLFFRLVDGFGDGQTGDSVYKLWRGQVTTSAAVDGSGLQFTRQELIDTLVAVFEAHNARSVRTLDFSFAFGASPDNDHADHEFSALFAAVASGAYQNSHDLFSFRTYNTSNAGVNVYGDEVSRKTEAFEYYAACDVELAVDSCDVATACSVSPCGSKLAPYYEWLARQYSMTRSAPKVTTLVRAGQCLTAWDASVGLEGCNSSAAQNWTLGADHTLRNSSGQCLTAPSSLNATSQVTLAACTASPRQRWFLMEMASGQGKIILAAAPTTGEENHYVRSRCLSFGGSLEVTGCEENNGSQEWNF